MVKIGVHLRKLSQNKNWGITFIGPLCMCILQCAVRLPVCLSVTRVDQSKTVDVRIMNFHHTVAPSSFCELSFIQNF